MIMSAGEGLWAIIQLIISIIKLFRFIINVYDYSFPAIPLAEWGVFNWLATLFSMSIIILIIFLITLWFLHRQRDSDH